MTQSDIGGRFSIPDLRPQGATRYVFRHLGLEVKILQADEFRSPMIVWLAAGPDYRMDGLEVSVTRSTCPIVDEPRARARWGIAAAAYHQSTSSRGIGGFFRGVQKEVSLHDVFRGIGGDFRATIALWEAWPTGVRNEYGRVKTLEDMVSTMGYAWNRELDGREYFFGRDRHLNWRYADLDTRSANHFATSVFGDLHVFSVLTEDDSGLRLQFCPVEDSGDRPNIHGTILIGGDDRMIEAEWRFSTRNPDEEAGGWVKFGTVRDPIGGLGHLVAERGVFFRHSGFESPFPDLPRWVYRDLREWQGWVVSPTGREPGHDRGTGGRN